MVLNTILLDSYLFFCFSTVLYCLVLTNSNNLDYYSDLHAEYHETCCQSINFGRYSVKENSNNVITIIMCPTVSSLVVCSATVNGSSCADILHQCPSAVSGYYNITLYNGSVISVYCDMEGDKCDGEGGWTRIGYLNMTQPNATCPNGLTLHKFDNADHGLCGTSYPFIGCQSTFYSSIGLNYTMVCGQVKGYLYDFANGFDYSKNEIDNHYVDGVSITKGSPRQHIWTYAAGDCENRSSYEDCPCNSGYKYKNVKPNFVGNDYYCESAPNYGGLVDSDPLWDGEQCNGLEGPCCNSTKLPWFVKTLEESNDYIEVRVCTGYYQPIDILEIFIK